MPPQPGPLPTLVSALRTAAALMIDELIARLHAAGYSDVTPAHHGVFENLDPGGTRLTELAARAGITHQSMSELVSVLERRGYLERRADPADAAQTRPGSHPRLQPAGSDPADERRLSRQGTQIKVAHTPRVPIQRTAVFFGLLTSRTVRYGLPPPVA